MLKEITKRDGSIVEFDPNKINLAIKKAFVAARGESDDELIGKLTKAVVRYLKANVPEDTTKTTIEDVQDAVEHVLIKYNLPKVAKEYILYRDLHNKIRTNKNILLDSYKLVGEYVDKVDWRVNENANSGYSYASMLNHISGSVVANYTLANMYPERIAKAHTDGDFHIHDLSAGIIPYCMGHSLKDLLMMGFVGVSGRASSKPAKHLDSALQQISNFMATLQTEAAGAQAFSSWDTYLAPFVRYDKLSYNQVKQIVQQFIFGLNIASRWGEAPFTNITLDLVPPHDLKDMPVIIGGELQDTTYGDYQKEMDMLNMAFIETMLEGDAEGKVFTFPIPTYNIVKDFNWDSEISHKLFELTCKYGSPYFANFLNSDMDVSDSRSMCPMDGNTKVIVKTNDSNFKVCTIADVYDAHVSGNYEFQTITPAGWKKAIPNRVEPTDVYHITLSNMVEVILGENHLQPVIVENGKALTLKAKDLKEGMYIPCNEYDCNNELFLKEFNQLVNHKITKVERKANSNYLYCFEVDNDSHTFYLANGMLTHNCRLRLDVKELRRKNGGLFGSGEKTGSVGVVTINMPRLGYVSKTKEEFFSKLEYLMILAKDSLEIKRKVAQRNIDNGLLPYTKIYITSLKNHFSTIGLVGMNEACLNLLGVDITTPEGNAFAVETMKFMRAKLSEFQEETDNLFNLEGSPAEGCSYRLAKIDKKKFSDIITAGTDENPYYTNSTQIPVGYTDDLFEACDLQNEVQSLYTGGTVEHLYLGERLEDPAQAAKLIKTLCTNYKIPYFSITPTFSICKVHGYIPGNHSECPYDKGPIERPAK